MKNIGIIEQLNDISTLAVIKDLIKESNPLTLVYENGTAGYTKLDNGLIIQWGQRTFAPTTTNQLLQLQYNIPFKKYGLPFCERSVSNHSLTALRHTVWPKDQKQFNLYIETSTIGMDDTYFWIAIGI